MITFKELLERFQQKKRREEDPCWAGYKQLGVKQKGDKTVPNCVPVEKDKE